MKRLAALLLITLTAFAAFAQTNNPAPASLSPAEQNMAVARKLIEKNPKDYEAYNALALALSRRARETSDVRYYTEGEAALQTSFEIAPDNYDGKRIQVWLLLGKHEFAAALVEAKKLNQKMPDDVMVYGFLTDSNVELGNYKDAENAAQWMLNLRPANQPAVTRAAYLRELFGDIDGALELMNMAFESNPPTQVEDGAWILSQMAHLNLSVGNLDQAEKELNQALAMFPGYHYALGNLAKVRIQQKRYGAAVELLTQRYQAAPHAENLYDLAGVLQLGGRNDEAAKAFAEFERKSLLETDRADNSNHELIFYYADYANRPDKALSVAQREIARRRDVHTLDCYAWALFKNGQYAEARTQIETALAVGIREASIFRHAGEIALQAGDKPAAERYLREAVRLNTLGSEQASTTLGSLQTASRVAR
ncbi:MAG TPA: tetratricopeptide repeat protein [Terriglobales bacterium]